jgi:hypothetical protein
LSSRSLCETCAAKPLVIKQGIHATDAGRGALNAAYSNLESMVCSAMPMVYGWLIIFCPDRHLGAFKWP